MRPLPHSLNTSFTDFEALLSSAMLDVGIVGSLCYKIIDVLWFTECVGICMYEWAISALD